MLPQILETIKKNLYLIFLIILISLLSFQLGKISKSENEPVKIKRASVQEIFGDQGDSKVSVQNQESENGGAGKIDFRVVVSKKSTSKKYHFLWCAGAKQIKEENKIYFSSEKEAISAGYNLASNCTK